METKPNAKIYENPVSLEDLRISPPRLILVFDNYRGSTPERVQTAEETMIIRALIASHVFHSDLYTDETRPTLCSFAGEHQEGDIAGSENVKKWLKLFGIPEEKIISRQTTITTTADITQLHSLAAEKRIRGSLAIVTTDDHVIRTAQEVNNHFARHQAQHGPEYPIPRIYVLSPSDKRLDDLKSKYTPSQIEKIRQFTKKNLSSGLSEILARFLATHRGIRFLQPLAELVTHPHVPKRVTNIRKIVEKFTA